MKSGWFDCNSESKETPQNLKSLFSSQGALPPVTLALGITPPPCPGSPQKPVFLHFKNIRDFHPCHLTTKGGGICLLF